MKESDWRSMPWLLGGMQALGFFVLRTSSVFLKVKRMSPFERSLGSVLTLQILLEMEIPLRDVINESHPLQSFEMNSKLGKQMGARIGRLIQSKQEMGTDIREDCSACISDIWDLWEEAYEKLIRQLMVLRFLCLGLFFLLPYFIFLFQFFSSHLGADL
jgi:hypothetical protein